MTPADLESLQQELQLGSPMILSDPIPPTPDCPLPPNMSSKTSFL